MEETFNRENTIPEENDITIESILEENERRKKENGTAADYIRGTGSVGKRECLVINDDPIPIQWVPKEMINDPLVRKVAEAGSYRNYLNSIGRCVSDKSIEEMHDKILRIRFRHDFPFWAQMLVRIKDKMNGPDIPFVLNRPQRRLVEVFERMRTSRKPIRVVLVKARQWGGSTCTQMYMAWMQLQVVEGINSLIVGHQNQSTSEVKDMYDRMIKSYPMEYLYKTDNQAKAVMALPKKLQAKLTGVGNTRNIFKVPQRNCKIKLGSAESPDSTRGADSSLVHLTEVGLWKKTDNKTPEQLIRAACGSTPLIPNTMIVMESTANGTGNFFHREYMAAKNRQSNYEPLFVAWWQIDMYSEPFKSEKEKTDFAEKLLAEKDVETVSSNREEPGAYYWYMWKTGATLEAINWYTTARKMFDDHADMASEYPTDDIEAFNFSGDRVFNRYQVEMMRSECRKPLAVGELMANGTTGEEALLGLHFDNDSRGALQIWEYPDDSVKYSERYLAVVDIGGRSIKSDWSVVCVIDRLPLANGLPPAVVAQWYGHTDMDLLAWKAAQIATFYDNALLVIESNTLETHDRDRQTDGEQSVFILSQIRNCYDNLYARKQTEEDIIEHRPVKYGFHTNTQTKPLVISTLVRYVRERLYIERDEKCLDEMLQYERKANGAYGAIQGAHDDLLMTRAIAMRISDAEMNIPQTITTSHQRIIRRSGYRFM